ncbi:ROK family protein [Vagococcus elongatus]|uniref:MarR family transcriptional regulator n=1 Tax=Vagococcus elongatus TaxID=180344 RepID=A0A430B194_9ENTE|nr:ROK family protein [Vagococcus elongatus]RSU14095.1 MarR family transcriptional regulator [Vagococcus elongatus]
MITSKYTIRERNEAIILQKIIDENIVSRANLATITNLNKASVSAITKKLMEEELIKEVGIGNASSQGGRKPVLLTFNRRSSLVLALDIGTNYVEGVLSFIDGTFIETIKKRKIDINEQTVITHIREIISELSEYTPETRHGVVGMTVAIHGIVVNNEIVYTPNYPLDHIKLFDELSNSFDFPIFLENEANLAALGEYTFSSKFNSLVSISIHGGIGAGIVENGLLRNGKHGKAGEIGHSILFPGGKQCPCGNEGCLERYASHRALYDQIEDTLNVHNINSDRIKEYYDENNQQVKEILLENANYLSIGINNLSSLYDPEIVVINSSVYQKIPELIDYLNKNLVSRFTRDVIVMNSPLQSSATLLGAVTKSAQNFLNIQNLKFID